jgi:hypothetical protein
LNDINGAPPGDGAPFFISLVLSKQLPSTGIVSGNIFVEKKTLSFVFRTIE